MIKKISALLFALLLAGIAFTVSADESTAKDITNATAFSGSGYDSFGFLKDKDIKGYKKSAGSAAITLENSEGISSIYLMFNLEYGTYTVTDNTSGKVYTAGEHGFLHEYIALDTPATSLTIRFENGAVHLSEIYAFSRGNAPDFVQQWDAPLDGKADIVLFATHGDDDHLFFAGLLPYYTSREDCAVQVVYMTDHRNLTMSRTHEMLNGLWAVGVRAYPVFGAFDDFLVESLEGSYKEFERLGHSREELQAFVVENVRRFKPQVAIGHDLNGEYKHGMHMVYADLLVKALDITGDATKFPESAEKYGTWEIPKTYLHLYEQNKIRMDWDQPLETFGGMTAFQVSQQLGYPCHESQQWTWFTKWINWENKRVGGVPVTKATQISEYSPCDFGLYRSNVGADVEKNDFLENITTYAEQERLRLEQEEQERLEQKEQERLEQEEQERLEQEEQERLEQERLEQERLQQEAQRKKELAIAIGVLAVLVIALVCVLISIRQRNIRRRRRKRAQRVTKNIP